MLEVPMVQVDAGLPPPSYARNGDAGVDLYSRVDTVIPAAGGRELVPTGIRLAIPEGYGGFVQPRSGLALRHGLTVVNSPGLIDSGYRAEIGVILLNTDPNEDFKVAWGDRIAQLVIQPVETVNFVAVDDLPDSERGHGGFGHSGR